MEVKARLRGQIDLIILPFLLSFCSEKALKFSSPGILQYYGFSSVRRCYLIAARVCIEMEGNKIILYLTCSRFSLLL